MARVVFFGVPVVLVAESSPTESFYWLFFLTELFVLQMVGVVTSPGVSVSVERRFGGQVGLDRELSEVNQRSQNPEPLGNTVKGVLD